MHAERFTIRHTENFLNIFSFCMQKTENYSYLADQYIPIYIFTILVSGHHISHISKEIMLHVGEILFFVSCKCGASYILPSPASSVGRARDS